MRPRRGIKVVVVLGAVALGIGIIPSAQVHAQGSDYGDPFAGLVDWFVRGDADCPAVEIGYAVVGSEVLPLDSEALPADSVPYLALDTANGGIGCVDDDVGDAVHRSGGTVDESAPFMDIERVVVADFIFEGDVLPAYIETMRGSGEGLPFTLITPFEEPEGGIQISQITRLFLIDLAEPLPEEGTFPQLSIHFIDESFPIFEGPDLPNQGKNTSVDAFLDLQSGVWVSGAFGFGRDGDGFAPVPQLIPLGAYSGDKLALLVPLMSGLDMVEPWIWACEGTTCDMAEAPGTAEAVVGVSAVTGVPPALVPGAGGSTGEQEAEEPGGDTGSTSSGGDGTETGTASEDAPATGEDQAGSGDATPNQLQEQGTDSATSQNEAGAGEEEEEEEEAATAVTAVGGGIPAWLIALIFGGLVFVGAGGYLYWTLTGRRVDPAPGVVATDETADMWNSRWLAVVGQEDEVQARVEQATTELSAGLAGGFDTYLGHVDAYTTPYHRATRGIVPMEALFTEARHGITGVQTAEFLIAVITLARGIATVGYRAIRALMKPNRWQRFKGFFRYPFGAPPVPGAIPDMPTMPPRYFPGVRAGAIPDMPTVPPRYATPHRQGLAGADTLPPGYAQRGAATPDGATPAPGYAAGGSAGKTTIPLHLQNAGLTNQDVYTEMLGLADELGLDLDRVVSVFSKQRFGTTRIGTARLWMLIHVANQRDGWVVLDNAAEIVLSRIWMATLQAERGGATTVSNADLRLAHQWSRDPDFYDNLGRAIYIPDLEEGGMRAARATFTPEDVSRLRGVLDSIDVDSILDAVPSGSPTPGPVSVFLPGGRELGFIVDDIQGTGRIMPGGFPFGGGPPAGFDVEGATFIGGVDGPRRVVSPLGSGTDQGAFGHVTQPGVDPHVLPGHVTQPGVDPHVLSGHVTQPGVDPHVVGVHLPALVDFVTPYQPVRVGIGPIPPTVPPIPPTRPPLFDGPTIPPTVPPGGPAAPIPPTAPPIPPTNGWTGTVEQAGRAGRNVINRGPGQTLVLSGPGAIDAARLADPDFAHTTAVLDDGARAFRPDPGWQPDASLDGAVAVLRGQGHRLGGGEPPVLPPDFELPPIPRFGVPEPGLADHALGRLNEASAASRAALTAEGWLRAEASAPGDEHVRVTEVLDGGIGLFGLPPSALLFEQEVTEVTVEQDYADIPTLGRLPDLLPHSSVITFDTTWAGFETQINNMLGEISVRRGWHAIADAERMLLERILEHGRRALVDDNYSLNPVDVQALAAMAESRPAFWSWVASAAAESADSIWELFLPPDVEFLQMVLDTEGDIDEMRRRLGPVRVAMLHGIGTGELLMPAQDLQPGTPAQPQSDDGSPEQLADQRAELRKQAEYLLLTAGEFHQYGLARWWKQFGVEEWTAGFNLFGYEFEPGRDAFVANGVWGLMTAPLETGTRFHYSVQAADMTKQYLTDYGDDLVSMSHIIQGAAAALGDVQTSIAPLNDPEHPLSAYAVARLAAVRDEYQAIYGEAPSDFQRARSSELLARIEHLDQKIAHINHLRTALLGFEPRLGHVRDQLVGLVTNEDGSRQAPNTLLHPQSVVTLSSGALLLAEELASAFFLGGQPNDDADAGPRPGGPAERQGADEFAEETWTEQRVDPAEVQVDHRGDSLDGDEYSDPSDE